MTSSFPWSEIENIFLDMDGVLLDKYFDDYFWEEFVPLKWVQKHGGTLELARTQLISTYKRVENTLAWCDLDYWSNELDLDIPGLKREASNYIDLRPGAIQFLDSMKSMGKPLSLVTNAHPKTLEVKMGKFDLTPWFDDIISADSVGYAKEQTQFWDELHNHLSFNPNTTFFADDTEKVLHSAEKSGIGHLLHIAQPSSRKPSNKSHCFTSTPHLVDVVDIALHRVV